MANSREKILAAVKTLQRRENFLPEMKSFLQPFEVVAKFTETLNAIGGKAHHIRTLQEAEQQLQKQLAPIKRMITTIPGFSGAEINRTYHELTLLDDVDLFITQSYLGVAENGAVWLKDEQLHERVLPFIAKHVAVIIDAKDIVPTMHEAYQKISNADYRFATFIAGPSKTADIEQSLVLGAHGAISMSVFVMDR